MDNLSHTLPKITRTILKGEDKVTTDLVLTLLQEVYVSQNKLDPYPTIRKVLDDKIDSLIDVGIIDYSKIEGEL